MLTGRRLPLTLAFVVLIGLAVGAGCRGFFVKPTLTQIAVGPATPTIQTGDTNNTQQFTAFGTFDDGSHSSNPAVSWGSSIPTVATISPSGLATAVNQGTTTITATSTQNPAISGTQLLTVTVGCIISIEVKPKDPFVKQGTDQPFTATATTCLGTVDITDVASWVSSDKTVATIDSSGVATTLAVGTTNITAASAGVTSPISVLTVTLP